ncbi:dihydrofolate reductase family protein [Actinokineospora enzanensis]|uniref:dihydrofolate reductase family protein n=1 Tax=Actinokineospora enzanensis TaxID=155975 RepID=UPI0003741453|nr:dihydrofolate reductase family protein [Actinokineospora enzanensis]
MGRVVVIEFVTVDGVVEDPDGRGGTPWGGWAFRHGPDSVAGDKFALGPLMDDGVLLLGRVTWELFAGVWPGRDDDFSRRMNGMDKLVVSRSDVDITRWVNSAQVKGDLVDAVKAESRDIVIAGSVGIVEQLRDLVDEYRLLVFPSVAGQGRRLFADAAPDLELVRAEQVGQAVRSVYLRK